MLRLDVIAVGKIAAGPENELINRYQERVRRLGPQVGVSLGRVRELAESRQRHAVARRREETCALMGLVQGFDCVVLLDERGGQMASRAFADRLAQWRDGGRQAVCFVMGGPDGVDRTLAHRIDHTLGLSKMTLPHQLARLVLCEQVYRALTILADHPYHRDG